MKIIYVIFIALTKFLLIKLEKLTPLSVCTKGRISNYSEWESGGSCGFNSHTNAVGLSYLYPIAPNEDLFNNSVQCGVCYEMVGPYGALRVRVEDSCKKDDKSGLCSGDMYHFNVADNGTSYLMGSGNLSNITFRMVSCNYTENIKIKTDKNIDYNLFSFVVLDHNLAISSISLGEDGKEGWTSLTREKNNYWSYYPSDDIYFPLTIRIFSINNDYVTVLVDKFESEKVYEADGNFEIPDDTYFNISSLEKVEIPSDKKECCELDLSDYNPIFSKGTRSNGYKIFTNKTSISYSYNVVYRNNPTMDLVFRSSGTLMIKSNFPIRADQFNALSITIKASRACSNCLYLRAYNLENNNENINFADTNWKTYYYDISSFGIQNNEFNGIVLNYYITSAQDFEIYIGNIELIENLDASDSGVCFDTENTNDGGDIIPVIPPVDDGDKNNTSSEKIQEYDQTDSISLENKTDINKDTKALSDLETGNLSQNETSLETSNTDSTKIEDTISATNNATSTDKETLYITDIPTEQSDKKTNIDSSYISDTPTYIEETDSIIKNDLSTDIYVSDSIVKKDSSTDIYISDSILKTDSSTDIYISDSILKNDSSTDIETDTIYYETISTNLITNTDTIKNSTTINGNSTSINTELNEISDLPTENTNSTGQNNTSYIDANASVVNIISISSMRNYPEIILVRCNDFKFINNENLTLLFISRDNSSYNFKSDSCSLQNNATISSFYCKLPFNISDGSYNVQSPSGNKYAVNLKENILISNRMVSFEDPNYEEPKESDQIINSTIIITNSIEQVVNRGDRITFQIIPIKSEHYSLENNQIILVDQAKTKYLYLKNCQGNNNNQEITSITCIVSNNIMRTNYTSLSNGQNITVLSNQKINLIGNNSFGGFISESIDRIINTDLTFEEKQNYRLIFKILYYNLNIKPGDLFPDAVYLLGIRTSTRRNLEETAYNTRIQFPNCTAGNYSNEDSTAIGEIRCLLPDFVPAGTYSKLESAGFDMVPNRNIRLFFQEDFNRTLPTNNDTNGTKYNKETDTDDSSSSSKTWIIWLVVAILVVILIVVIIIACYVSRNKIDDIPRNTNEIEIKKADKSDYDNSQNTITKSY